ncbi:hypothetical protein [Rhizobium sp. MHM7A]|uniref:hypothetical protein n=1 Tax=Rhizobium sp. MHM7A TaxID=2583233 RepID=UPI001105ED54|nr:hypothetical protein [Rhizobium sp. MHM7A]TLX16664.1 hypothetical protein FFR93_04800 [Rhizobium sp. MHM7A]
MGGVIAVGIRREPGQFETIEVWTNQLPRTIQNGKFLSGDVSGLEAYLDEHKTDARGLYGVSKNVPSQYGYVLVDYVDRRVVTVSAYGHLSAKTGASFYVGVELGNDEDRESVSSLMEHIRSRWSEDALIGVGPFATPQELIADPDFKDANVYHISSSFWKIEDCNENKAGYTYLRDILKTMVTFDYAEEIAWSKATGDRQPVIDY